jgi:octopine/nopaline transport system substrate-binding protein
VKRAYVLPILATLAAFLVPSEVVGKDWKHVTIGTEAAYPPFNMRTRDGQLIGFDIDLGNDLCTRIKVSCEFVPQDFSGLIGALTAGKFDAIMSGMSITPKRMEIISFSVPYVISLSEFAVRKNGALADLPDEGARISLDDKDAFAAEIAKLAPQLHGKTVGVESATTHADMLATYFKDIVTIRTYSQSADRDLDLQTGRIDAALELVAHFAPTLAEQGSTS